MNKALACVSLLALTITVIAITIVGVAFPSFPDRAYRWKGPRWLP